MNRNLKFKAIAIALVLFPAVSDAEVFIKADELSESSARDGNWFVVDSFSFGVEREMKESGEKGGTADINIGIGELRPVTIIKAIDQSTPKLAQYAINGLSLGDIEVCVTDNPDAPTACYLRYKLERCFIKSWSTSGDADDRPTEEVAFYYNKIAFAYADTRTGESGFETVGTMSWDNVKNLPWESGELSLMDYR